MSFSWASLVFEPVSQSGILQNDFVSYQLNPIDKVYFFWDPVDIPQEKQTKSTLELKKGIYVLDIYAGIQEYEIQHENFTLSLKSPGKILVDTRNSLETKIFSFDAIFTIDFLSKNEVMTSLTFYPHMFLSGNMTRNNFIKNADFLRLESIFHIEYNNEPFSVWGNTINPNFLTHFSWVDGDFNQILSFVFQDQYNSDARQSLNPENLKLYKWNELFGLKYIEKYALFFLNKEKKSIYYKKTALWYLNQLYKPQLTKGQASALGNEILDKVKELQELRSWEAENFQKVLFWYYYHLLKVNSLDYIYSTMELAHIIETLEQKENHPGFVSYFYLNKIYSLIDLWVERKIFLQKNLLIFLKNYLTDSELKIVNDTMNFAEKPRALKEVDALSYYLKNIFLWDLTFADNHQMENIFETLDLYFSFTKAVVLSYNNAQRYETTLVENQKIFAKVLSEMRSNFFQTEKNDRQLLVLNPKNILSFQQMERLNIFVKNLFSFFDKYKSYISDKNKIYTVFYTKNKATYDEYFLALSNYTEYTIQYDPVRSQLLSTKTIAESEQKVTLSQSNLLQYLGQFRGVNTSGMSVSIVKNTYYKVSNLSVQWDTFSFDLSPNDGYKMENITKNGVLLGGSYDLESMKQAYDALVESSDGQQEVKWFQDFFLMTFYPKSWEKTNTQVVETVDTALNEDNTIMFFKRDKLFGNKGDFTTLGNSVAINYNDVIVTLKWQDQYNISVKKWVLSNFWQEGVQGIFSGEYVFSNTSHYFINLKIRFFIENDEQTPLFGGQEFAINIPIQTKTFMPQISSQIQQIFANN